MNKPLLPELKFNNRFASLLPGDSETRNFNRQVHAALHSHVLPTPVANPVTLICSAEVLETLGLTSQMCASAWFAEVFAGNRLLDGMYPYATCYGGHQFGRWAGQLGDGRAINLGEVVTPAGNHLTLQLKGAGPTPYSRGADGRAVLRSSIREFLCSEAMHHLGVPTTRALSLVATGEEVIRDMFYDGNPVKEPGAIVCRVAPSFTRFGHFQLPAFRGDKTLLQKLLDTTIATDFAHLLVPQTTNTMPAEMRIDYYLNWFEEVCMRTVTMIVHWQRVGFVHGVMNTDNMSILGLTIDYGPYGWMDSYDPHWTPNTTDAEQRRYQFSQQPAIARWNLYQLANALLPIIEDAEALEKILARVSKSFTTQLYSMQADKLGLDKFDVGTDADLVEDLEQLLLATETDMTLFYRQLAAFDPADDTSHIIDLVATAHYAQEKTSADPNLRAQYQAWEEQYRTRLLGIIANVTEADWLLLRQKMKQTNPRFVLRNYLTQTVIEQAEQGDFSPLEELLEVMRRPYEEQPGRERFAAKRPDWARTKAGCSMLSCSS